MNVLITGGCGFIGSFVAERFHKEGHRIYIIDNLSSGQKSNVTVPHKLYQMDVEDQKCDEIIQSISPDIVVHLAAQVDVNTSVNRPHVDTQSNILGLVNILRSASKAGVSKFVFASSAAVYGPYDEVSLKEDLNCSPVSPYGMNKYLGEYYCDKWTQLYGLPTLCFRFSNVYGPRQGSVGEGGVVSIFMERLRDRKEFNVYGDGGQTRDFIYVEDLVDGIYRGANSQLGGVYNLSTNTETSVNELIAVLGSLHPIEKTNYLDARQGDIYRSSLDNTRVKRDLDWVPIYSLQEGLSRTLEWFQQSQDSSSEVKEKKKISAPKWWPDVKAYAENLLAFAVMAGITLFGADKLLHTSIDLKLIYVILLGVFYGTRQSTLAAILASGLYIFESLSNGREVISLLYDPEVLFVIAMYLFFGLIVGFVSDKGRRDNQRINSDLAVLNEKYAFLKGVYKDTRTVKEELQRQLISSKDSIGRIHSIIKSLESLEPEEIVTSSVGVLKNLLETERISVYSVSNSDFLRLMISSNAPDFLLPKTLRLSEHHYLHDVVTKGKIFSNKSLHADQPVLAAPIVHEGQVIAVVAVHDLAFDRLNLHYENLFKVSVDLISGSLSRAFQYVGVTHKDRFVDETAVLTQSVFLQVLQTKIVAKQQHNTDFVLLGVEASGQPIKGLSERISGSLRDSDYLGMLKDRIVLLLSNSNNTEADIVIQRLNKNGVRTEVINEEEAYA
ncbi:NAD-dependent epimerase/dehydratase family protein [Paenibacillus oenotherae]|uniref:NAD-dependent epimerase/dehydratase family protein n=1 Tax=Paenibacillus oenotherae TaxID=1435645 RepID=A0ABS7D498_9BACL|nr:NAD-dependent epimerase/dehydratase family protein [Paenibacillus oenotherae]